MWFQKSRVSFRSQHVQVSVSSPLFAQSFRLVSVSERQCLVSVSKILAETPALRNIRTVFVCNPPLNLLVSNSYFLCFASAMQAEIQTKPLLKMHRLYLFSIYNAMMGILTSSGLSIKDFAVKGRVVQCGHFSDKGRREFFRCGRPHFLV